MQGAKADIIVINLHSLMVGPIHDPIRTMINSCTGNDISTVIVNGKTIIEDYKVIEFEEYKILSNAQWAYDEYVELYRVYDKDHKKPEKMFPNSFQIKHS